MTAQSKKDQNDVLLKSDGGLSLMPCLGFGYDKSSSIDFGQNLWTPESTGVAFANSMAFFKKKIALFSKKGTVPNSQIRLILTQLENTLKTFVERVSVLEYVRHILEIGELMVFVAGMERAAIDVCFSSAYKTLEKQQQANHHFGLSTDLMARAKFNIQMGEAYIVEAIDPLLKQSNSIERILQSIGEMKSMVLESASSSSSDNGILLRGLVYIYYIGKRLSDCGHTQIFFDVLSFICDQMDQLFLSSSKSTEQTLLHFQFIRQLLQMSLERGDMHFVESTIHVWIPRLQSINLSLVGDKWVGAQLDNSLQWIRLLYLSVLSYKAAKRGVNASSVVPPDWSHAAELIQSTETSLEMIITQDSPKIIRKLSQEYTLCWYQDGDTHLDTVGTSRLNDKHPKDISEFLSKSIHLPDLGCKARDDSEPEGLKTKVALPAKKMKAPEESDDHKSKRQFIQEIWSLIRPIKTKEDKFGALLFTLISTKHAIKSMDMSTTSSEKKTRDFLTPADFTAIMTDYIIHFCLSDMDDPSLILDGLKMKDLQNGSLNFPIQPLLSIAVTEHLIEENYWEKSYWFSKQILKGCDAKKLDTYTQNDVETLVLLHILNGITMVLNNQINTNHTATSLKSESTTHHEAYAEHMRCLLQILDKRILVETDQFIIQKIISLLWRIIKLETVSRRADSHEFIRNSNLLWQSLEVAFDHILTVSMPVSYDEFSGIFNLYSTALETSGQYALAKEQALRAFSYLCDIQSKRARNPKEITISARNKNRRQDNLAFSDLQVDILAVIYRCSLKLRKPNHVVVKFEEDSAQGEFVKEMNAPPVGDNPVMKAILNLAILSEPVVRKDHDISKIAMKTHQLLKQASDLEKAHKLLFEVPTSFKPFIVGSTANSCTVAISSQSLPEMSFRPDVWIYAVCAPRGTHLSSSSVALPGSGISTPLVQNRNIEVTIHGLSSNIEYQFAFVIISTEKGDRPVISERISYIPSWSLSLPLCWGYLGSFCYQDKLVDIAASVIKFLENQFLEVPLKSVVDKIIQPSVTLSNKFRSLQQLLPIKTKKVRGISKAIKKMYVQNLLMYHTTVGQESSRNFPCLARDITREARKTDLWKLTQLMVAAFAAKDARESELLVWVILEIYKIIHPFLADQSDLPIINTALLLCHESLSLSYSHTREDFVPILRDIYLPIAYALTKRLINSDLFQAATCVEANTVAILNRFGLGNEMKISNSATIEQLILGYTTKTKKGQKGHGKAQCIAEFSFHAKAAIMSPIDKGLNLSQTPAFAFFRDTLELIIAKESLLVSKVADTGSYSDILQGSNKNRYDVISESLTSRGKRPHLLTKKNLETQIVLKDIFTVFLACGPEGVMQELSRFKKNSRYVEVVARIVEWCHEKEQFESVQRISNDLEEWADKRIQVLTSFDTFSEEGESSKESQVKWRKRHLFSVEKSNGDSVNKHGKEKNPSFKVKSISKVKDQSHLENGKRGETKSEPDFDRKNAKKTQSLDNGPSSKSTTSKTDSTTSTSKSSKDTDRGADSTKESSNGSRPPSRGISSGNQHKSAVKSAPVLKRPVSAVATKNSQSNSDESHMSFILQQEQEQASFIAQKRKRLQQRHAYFAGMAVQEKEKKESAAKALDYHLGTLWHKRRYMRRLRLILSHEAPWKCQILYYRAASQFEQARRETSKDSYLRSLQANHLHDFFDMEWFQLSKAGDFLEHVDTHQMHESEWSLSHSTTAVSDMLQSCVQSIVLSGRYGLWAQTFASSHLLWRMLRHLNRLNRFQTDFWKSTLWRGLYVAVDVLLEVLQHVTIRRHDSTQPLNLFDMQNYFLFYDSELTVSWDVSGKNSTAFALVDGSVILDNIMFTFECLKIATKWNRLLALVSRTRTIFGVSLDQILKKVELMAKSSLSSQSFTGIELVGDYPLLNLNDAFLHCRELYARYMMVDITSSSIDRSESDKRLLSILQAHERTSDLCRSQNEIDLFAYISYQKGDILQEAGNYSGAAVFWLKCTEAIFQHQKAPHHWRKILKIPEEFRFKHLSKYTSVLTQIPYKLRGAKNVLVSAMAMIKLARFFYYSNHHKQMELLICASILFISVCLSEHDGSTEDIVSVLSTMDKSIFRLPLLDKHLLNPSAICESLIFTAKRLARCDGNLVLELLFIAENVATKWMESIPQSIEISFTQAIVLCQLGYPLASISQFQSSTRRLVTNESEMMQIANALGYMEHVEYPITVSHLHALRSLTLLGLIDKSKSVYPSNIHDFEVARANIILSFLAGGHTTGAVLSSSHRSENDTNFNLNFEQAFSVPVESLPFIRRQNIEPNRLQFYDVENQCNDVLESTRANLAKLIAQIQFSLKAKLGALSQKSDDCLTISRTMYTMDSFLRLSNRLVSAVYLLANVSHLQGRFRAAAKWFRSIRVFLQVISPSDSSKPILSKVLVNQFGVEFMHQNRLSIIDSLYADGLLDTCYKLASEGISAANETKSRYYQLCFWTRLLQVWIRGYRPLNPHIAAGQIVKPTMAQLCSCYELIRKMKNEYEISNIVTRSYATCMLHVVQNLIQNHDKSHSFDMVPLLDQDYADNDMTPSRKTIYSLDALPRYIVWAYHGLWRIVNSKYPAVAIAQEFGQVILESPLQIPLFFAVRLSIAISNALMSQVCFWNKSSLHQNETNILIDLLNRFIAFAVKELINVGGYDHDSLLACLKNLLQLCVMRQSSTETIGLIISYTAEISHMKAAIKEKLVPIQDEISSDDLAPSVAHDLTSFINGTYRDSHKEWYPEVHDLLYMDEMCMLERHRNTKSMPIRTHDLLDYRSFLDTALQSDDIFYDECDAVLFRKRHRLHLTMMDKCPWYSELCAKWIDLFDEKKQSSKTHEYIEKVVAYAWITPSNTKVDCHRTLCIFSNNSPNEGSSSMEAADSSYIQDRRLSRYKSIIMSDDDIQKATRSCQRLISTWVNFGEDIQDTHLQSIKNQWNEVLSLFCSNRNTQNSPTATLSNAVFVLTILSASSNAEGWNLKRGPPQKETTNTYLNLIHKDFRLDDSFSEKLNFLNWVLEIS